MKTTSCRVPSSQATPKTVLSRSKELDHHRKTCSGGDQGYQLGREIKACSLQQREEILQDLQDGFKVQIPTNQALAMKADLGIPWAKLRAIRSSLGAYRLHCNIHFRWFKECSVSIPSEKLMRKRAGEVIGDSVVVVEKVALTFPLKSSGGEEVRLRPFGYIPDLWAKVVQLLEQNERYS